MATRAATNSFSFFSEEVEAKRNKGLFYTFMRKTRKLQENSSYHVMARANHKELLMEDSLIKDMFIKVVERAKKKYDFEIVNFVVLGNHFHFILKPGMNANLSVIMKWILQTFAQKYNKANNLWGHFWGGRFFSWIIPNFWEYIRVFTYIDNNPVAAGLVDQTWNWDWGGLGFRRKGRGKFLVKLADWLKLLFPAHELLVIGGRGTDPAYNPTSCYVS